jgi:N-acetylglucosamine kinase-like BadF-type ATPase
MVARVDGWGNLIGDCGSAYWIGRAGLERGLKAYDGRLPETKLLEILWDNFSHPEDAYIDLQGSPNRVARIASFARRVLDLASEDAAAMEIVTLAASELALSAFTAARRSGAVASGRPLFSFAGNVMKAEVLRGEIETKLRVLVPEALIEPPKGEPIAGVVLLPKVSPTSPLYKEIRVAHA